MSGCQLLLGPPLDESSLMLEVLLAREMSETFRTSARALRERTSDRAAFGWLRIHPALVRIRDPIRKQSK